MKSVTPHFFYISDIANSSSFNGKIFRKKSMLENFCANVLKAITCDRYITALISVVKVPFNSVGKLAEEQHRASLEKI